MFFSLCTSLMFISTSLHVSTGAKGCMIELLLGMARVKINGVTMFLWELQYFLLGICIMVAGINGSFRHKYTVQCILLFENQQKCNMKD